jgi:biopolymer transport protein ExbB/TolQ
MSLTELFYSLSQALLHPVLWAIYAAFIYSLFEVGRFFAQWVIRAFNASDFVAMHHDDGVKGITGYPVTLFHSRQSKANLNDIEVFAFKKLENIKIVTRVTPMLGLIATLIPMGPALMALTENNVVEMSEHLRTAFTAVILALAAASLTFWVASVKKRWFAEEIVVIEKRLPKE